MGELLKADGFIGKDVFKSSSSSDKCRGEFRRLFALNRHKAMFSFILMAHNKSHRSGEIIKRIERRNSLSREINFN